MFQVQQIAESLASLIEELATEAITIARERENLEAYSAEDLREMWSLPTVAAVYKLDIPKFKPTGENGHTIRFLKSDVLEFVRKNRLVKKEAIYGKKPKLKVLKKSA